ncbi:hypothetical protein EV421DRAFT_1742258 [Armillaria borealis]|uniref:Uncharacterized protein n=1 Tax=Armillaria borealis TaxID=47425 RepID=A0AA39MGE4_9AGAR|nr:hypothetical protein EV421DRAFT_1742258 [Armillaria borealis]
MPTGLGIGSVGLELPLSELPWEEAKQTILLIVWKNPKVLFRVLLLSTTMLIRSIDRMTFSAGIRGCIGSMAIRLQNFSVTSNSAFRWAHRMYSLVQWASVQTPTVPGKAKEGPQVPLLVTPLSK